VSSLNGSGAPLPVMRWRRGDRVRVPTGQGAVVEGWKDGRLLVLFGAMDRKPFRAWVDEETVMFVRHHEERDGPL
jgi:hypothetical protein